MILFQFRVKFSSVPKVVSLNLSVGDHYQTVLNKLNMSGKELLNIIQQKL